jgi:single-strand DNA-binding protein
MARGLNKVMLIGHLGKDPELKYTPGGAAVATFSLATTEGYKDKEGNWQERPEWHRLVVWNKQAEVAAEYLKKGQQIFVEGRLQTRTWDKDGQKHYTTEIVVQNFQMLGRKGEGGSGAPDIPTPSDDLAPPPAQSDREDLPF